MLDEPGQVLSITLQHKATYNAQENTALDAHQWGVCGREVKCVL